MFCVSNHPTSFIEPCLMACFLPITFHFLVRGDVFKKKWLNWLLVGTNQIPIFRKQDGADNVRKNLDTQERLKELFQENKVILIFPEASTEEHMYLRPLKKGVARFAFMNEDLDLQILPLGVNYQWGTPFNSEVTISIGESIAVDDFKADNYDSPSARINALMDKIRIGMESCLRHLKNKDDESFLYHLFQMLALQNPSNLLPFKDHKDFLFTSQKKMITSIEEDPVTKQKAEDIADKYKHVDSVKPKWYQPLVMTFFAPLFMIGILFQLIPIWIARYIVKAKIKSHEFKVSVFCAVWLVINLIVGILAVILSIFNIKILIYYLVIALLGVFAFYYLKAFSRQWKYIFQSRSKRKLSDELLAEDLDFLIK